MPLGPKATQIRRKLHAKHGRQKGDRIFFASVNKGTIREDHARPPGLVYVDAASVGLRLIDLKGGRHVAGTPYRYRHGWIPISGMQSAIDKDPDLRRRFGSGVASGFAEGHDIAARHALATHLMNWRRANPGAKVTPRVKANMMALSHADVAAGRIPVPAHPPTGEEGRERKRFLAAEAKGLDPFLQPGHARARKAAEKPDSASFAEKDPSAFEAQQDRATAIRKELANLTDTQRRAREAADLERLMPHRPPPPVDPAQEQAEAIAFYRKQATKLNQAWARQHAEEVRAEAKKRADEHQAEAEKAFAGRAKRRGVGKAGKAAGLHMSPAMDEVLGERLRQRQALEEHMLKEHGFVGGRLHANAVKLADLHEVDHARGMKTRRAGSSHPHDHRPKDGIPRASALKARGGIDPTAVRRRIEGEGKAEAPGLSDIKAARRVPGLDLADAVSATSTTDGPTVTRTVAGSGRHTTPRKRVRGTKKDRCPLCQPKTGQVPSKPARVKVKGQAFGLSNDDLRLIIDLVGPKGYVHGWIKVGEVKEGDFVKVGGVEHHVHSTGSLRGERVLGLTQLGRNGLEKNRTRMRATPNRAIERTGHLDYAAEGKPGHAAMVAARQARHLRTTGAVDKAPTLPDVPGGAGNRNRALVGRRRSAFRQQPDLANDDTVRVLGLDLAADSMAKATTPRLLGTHPLWHKPGFKLPDYIEHVASHFIGSHGKSRAIAMAIGIIKNWAHGHPSGGEKGLQATTIAAARLALSQWEALKARAKSVKSNFNLARPDSAVVDLVGPKGFVHGWIKVGSSPADLRAHLASHHGGHDFPKPSAQSNADLARIHALEHAPGRAGIAARRRAAKGGRKVLPHAHRPSDLRSRLEAFATRHHKTPAHGVGAGAGRGAIAAAVGSMAAHGGAGALGLPLARPGVRTLDFYNPSQQRAPAGGPLGGEWTAKGGAAPTQAGASSPQMRYWNAEQIGNYPSTVVTKAQKRQWDNWFRFFSLTPEQQQSMVKPKKPRGARKPPKAPPPPPPKLAHPPAALIDLVGPKGYIHGWIKVGADGEDKAGRREAALRRASASAAEPGPGTRSPGRSRMRSTAAIPGDEHAPRPARRRPGRPQKAFTVTKADGRKARFSAAEADILFRGAEPLPPRSSRPRSRAEAERGQATMSGGKKTPGFRRAPSKALQSKLDQQRRISGIWSTDTMPNPVNITHALNAAAGVRPPDSDSYLHFNQEVPDVLDLANAGTYLHQHLRSGHGASVRADRGHDFLSKLHRGLHARLGAAHSHGPGRGGSQGRIVHRPIPSRAEGTKAPSSTGIGVGTGYAGGRGQRRTPARPRAGSSGRGGKAGIMMMAAPDTGALLDLADAGGPMAMHVRRVHGMKVPDGTSPAACARMHSALHKRGIRAGHSPSSTDYAAEPETYLDLARTGLDLAVLKAAGRKSLPDSAFGLPEQRKYPMKKPDGSPDKRHASNAKARAAQMLKRGRINQAQHDKIVAKANRTLASS